MRHASELSDNDRVDVLIIGGGPSGAVVANEMSRHGFSVVCLEQGRWVNPVEFPGDKPEWELLSQHKWNHDPNIRGFAEDYPLAVDESDLNPVMIGGVGGSSLFYGGHWMRLLPSDFRMYSLDGVGDDWPLTYDELAPFYDKVDAAVGRGRSRGRPDVPTGHGAAPPPAPHRQDRAPRGPRDEQAWLALVAVAECDRIPAVGSAGPLREVRHLRDGVSGGRQGVIRHHPLAGGHQSGRTAEDALSRPQDHHRRARSAPTGQSISTIRASSASRRRASSCWPRMGSGHRDCSCCLLIPVRPTAWRNSSGLVGKRLMLHPNGEVTGIYDEPHGQLARSGRTGDPLTCSSTRPTPRADSSAARNGR